MYLMTLWILWNLDRPPNNGSVFNPANQFVIIVGQNQRDYARSDRPVNYFSIVLELHGTLR